MSAPRVANATVDALAWCAFDFANTPALADRGRVNMVAAQRLYEAALLGDGPLTHRPLSGPVKLAACSRRHHEQYLRSAGTAPQLVQLVAPAELPLTRAERNTIARTFAIWSSQNDNGGSAVSIVHRTTGKVLSYRLFRP